MVSALGDADAGGEQTGHQVLASVEVEFKEGLLHGDTSPAAGWFVAGISGYDGVFDFQLGEKADLFIKAMSDEQDQPVEGDGSLVLFEIPLIKGASITGNDRFIFGSVVVERILAGEYQFLCGSPVGLLLLGIYPCRCQRTGCQDSYESFHGAKEERKAENSCRKAENGLR